ncbi:hypothetical protein RAA17_21285 [Komagataeibacter rhaeticus]|nr:hypothetical protein [Komagataeibacter rhaeticus]
MAKDLFLSWTNAVMQVIENTTVFMVSQNMRRTGPESGTEPEHKSSKRHHKNVIVCG